MSKRKTLSFEPSTSRTRGSDLFVGEISTHYEEEDDEEEDEDDESDDFLEKVHV